MSVKAEAITFWPRSWPSWPTLATSTFGGRPSASRKAATACFTCSILCWSFGVAA
jgi:hypothetical protein